MESLVDQITEIVGHQLGELGFKKSRRVFNRVQDRCVIVIDIQSDKWSPKDTFTVNLGTTVQPVYEFFHGIDFFGKSRGIDTSDCMLRTRLAAQVPEGSRFAPDFFTLTPQPFERDAAALEHAIEEYALPWLQARSTVEAMRDRYTEQFLLGDLRPAGMRHLAVLLYVLEDRAGMDRVLDALLERWREKPHNISLVDFAANLREFGLAVKPQDRTQEMRS